MWNNPIQGWAGRDRAVKLAWHAMGVRLLHLDHCHHPHGLFLLGFSWFSLSLLFHGSPLSSGSP